VKQTIYICGQLNQAYIAINNISFMLRKYIYSGATASLSLSGSGNAARNNPRPNVKNIGGGVICYIPICYKNNISLFLLKLAFPLPDTNLCPAFAYTPVCTGDHPKRHYRLFIINKLICYIQNHLRQRVHKVAAQWRQRPL
jgi:hypothetical protein